MSIPRWNPTQEPTRAELIVLKRLRKSRKLFAFLRLHRHQLFDDEFQSELETMYRDTGAGSPALPPAMMCMVLLLQSYMQISDAEAVELSIVDARWQLVLDCWGTTTPLFSQGAVQAFRGRMIAHQMDQRLLERTVQLARETKEFDWKKLPKDLRIGVDSRPLVGAGRVEDTLNLLGHIARKIAIGAASVLKIELKEVCRRARCPLLMASSVKAGLDINWSNKKQKEESLQKLHTQITSLARWVERRLPENGDEVLVRGDLETLERIEKQDLEHDSEGRVQRIVGVAVDRQVSIEDDEMRHGRKTKTKRFNGYKEHVAADLDTRIILACEVTPANVPEDEASPSLARALSQQAIKIGELSIDRAYINGVLVDQVEAANGKVYCKPWAGRNSKADLFPKSDFKFDIDSSTVTCPAGEVEYFTPGRVVHFDPEACCGCPLREKCTTAASGRGRTIHINEHEARQEELRKLQSSKKGRAQLRRRVVIEHVLAHISSRKGPRARYRGTAKNKFDLYRAACVQNLETIHRTIETSALPATG